MSPYELLRTQLAAHPRRWLITGVAGFIGSHLLETLLALDQEIVGLDDFSTGSARHLQEVRASVTETQWSRFTFCEGSVVHLDTCHAACTDVDYILHQAGFVSVPRSLEDPRTCHETNVTGTLNILLAAREAGVRRVVYASSSAVYGDDARLPKIEGQIGRPLSPYGASKLMAEIYARLFYEQCQVESVGLRYFNIFGPRQSPTGGYAAVIPQWITKLLRGEECMIHGDGAITRDFCPVSDAVQANLLAATTEIPLDSARIYNVALGGATTLVHLYALLSEVVTTLGVKPPQPIRYGPARPGDILRSAADTTAIRTALGFEPSESPASGLDTTVRWFANDSSKETK